MPERLTFGIDRDPGVAEGNGGSADRVSDGKGRLGAYRVNPLLRVYGPGPEGARCGSCVHLFRVGGVAGRYYKCDLRRNSAGPASDHRVRWPACARFERDPDA